MRAVILACAAATACTAPPSVRIPNSVAPPARQDVVREVAPGTTLQLRHIDIVRGRVTERTLLDGLSASSALFAELMDVQSA